MTVSMQANEQPNILIVDDISTNLVILSEMVKATGCIPRPVTNVKQAQRVAGIPPNRAETILPAPWATSSVLERCFPPIMPSATTQESR